MGEAVRWFRRAAEQEFPSAQFSLGLMYYHGHGVPRDYAETARWWRRAAEQGYANAQSSLGTLYDQGTGVPQNYAEGSELVSRGC
jgi:uncharacterized protein